MGTQSCLLFSTIFNQFYRSRGAHCALCGIMKGSIMNAYEQMKNNFLVELNTLLPGMSGAYQSMIIKSIDKAAFAFDITEKQTALIVQDDPVPPLVKTYIVVKKTEGLSNATLQNYARTLKLFFLWIRKAPESVTANDIRMFLYDYQNTHTVSDRTLDKYREIICWFFHWAFNEEYIPKNPGRSVKAIRHEIKERQALTQIELEYLRMAAKTPREKAMIEFMYSTGCRVSELVGVKKTDIDFKSGTVHLFGKGRKHRTSYINAKCEVALKEYLSSRSDVSNFLFVSQRAPHGAVKKESVEKVMRILSERTGLKKRITPHILRHTSATQAVNNGMPIEDVSAFLGHNSVSTTMIYAKVSDSRVQTHHLKCVI